MLSRDEIAAIYDSLSAPLLRYILRFVPDKSAAEDILHDTFVRFIEHSSGYTFIEKSPAPILYKIARNRSLDFIKSASRVVLDTDYISTVPQPPEHNSLNIEIIAEIDRFVLGLDEKHRAAYFLRRDNDLIYPELAKLSGIPERTLKRRVAETLALIAEYIKKGGLLLFFISLWHLISNFSLHIWKV